MNSVKKTARLAGLLYFLMSITALLGFMYIPPKFFVAGDPAATARRILDGELLYRAGILSALVSQILFIFVVLTLYELFKDVDRKLARLMLALVSVGVAAEIVVIAGDFAPLVLLEGADGAAAFTRPQLEALAFGVLQLGGSLGQVVTVFWGLWLFPFGILTIKSGFLPKLLGWLLMAAGVGYVVTCVTSIVFPAELGTVSRLMMPLYFGEFPIILWLLIVGAREA